MQNKLLVFVQAGSGHIFEEDVHYIVQMMNSRINAYNRDCRELQLSKMMSMMSAKPVTNNESNESLGELS